MAEPPKEVMSDLLDYTKNSYRATACKSLRVKSPAQNGATFSPSNQIIFRFPQGVRNTFLDGESLYIRVPLKVTAGAAAKSAFLEGSCGAYSFFNKIEILSDSQTISSIQNYAELMSVFSDLEASPSAKDNRLNLMHGMKSTRFAGMNLSTAAA